MNKFVKKASVVTAMVAFSTLVFAAFSSGQTAEQVKAEIAARLANNESLESIAQAALAANIGAGVLTTELLATPGLDAATVVTAVIDASGDSPSAAAAVAAAARTANVPAATIQTAVVAASPALANDTTVFPPTASGPNGNQNANNNNNNANDNNNANNGGNNNGGTNFGSTNGNSNSGGGSSGVSPS